MGCSVNLKQIRDTVLLESDYSPNDTSYHAWLNAAIDRIHRQIWSSQPWTFATKVADVPIFADKNSSDWSATIAVVQGQTAATTDTPVFRPWDGGQVIEIGGLEYTIASILTTSTCTLDQPYRGTTDESATFKIKHRNVFLPPDVVELLDVSWRNAPAPGATSGGVTAIQQKLEAQSALSLQDTGSTPRAYVHIPDTFIRTPEETLTPTLTLSTSSSNGHLPAGTYSFTYSYVLATEDEDSYGLLPQSDPWPDYVSVTVPTSNTNSINFAVFAPQSKYSASDKPVRIKIYYVDVLYDGRLYLQELRAADELGPLYADTSGTVNIGADMLTPSPRPIRPPMHGGRTRGIRLWPRPDHSDVAFDATSGDQIDEYARSFVQVTYMAKPEQILLDSDTPGIPEEFHQILVDKALAEVHLRRGNLTANQIYERRADDRMKLMAVRYGNHKDSMVVRGVSGNLFGHRQGLNVVPSYPVGWNPTYRGS